MIASPHNEKLKLVRQLPSASTASARASSSPRARTCSTRGSRPAPSRGCCSAPPAAASGARRSSRSCSARSRRSGPGTRAIAVWPQRRGRAAPRRIVRLPARGRRPRETSARSCARRDALLDGTVALGPRAAPIPTRRRRCGRAWARSSPARRSGRRSRRRRSPGSALVAHGGEPRSSRSAAAATVCLGAERDGAPGARCSSALRERVTIPLRPGGAESLNVAAAAAIACEHVAGPTADIVARACGRRGAMLERIEEIRSEAEAAIGAAAGTAELEELRVRYLGRKAELTGILRGIAELPAEERGPVGKRREPAPGSSSRQRLEAAGRRARRGGARGAPRPRPRSTSPCPARRRSPVGHLHLITRTTRQIEDVMVGLGYRVMEGPEVEHDYYNFTALNHPPGHPARMLQDTFYVATRPRPRVSGSTAVPPGPEDVLLRTHTSPVQPRSMEAQPPPIFIIAPGKVYRRDSGRDPQPHVPPGRGPRGGRGHHARRPAGDARGDAEGDLRPRARGPHAAPVLPLHRAQRRVRRLLLPVRRRGQLAGGRALQPLQGHRLDRGRRRRHGRPQRARLRRARAATTRSASRGSRSGWASSGSRCSSHGVPDLRRFFDNDVRVLEQFHDCMGEETT